MWRRVALAWLLATAAPTVSRAYLCALFPVGDVRNDKNVKARLQESDLVFGGTVTNLDPVNAPRTSNGGRWVVATFQVADRWKGPTAPLIRIIAIQESEDLQLHLAVGKEYLVFATLRVVNSIPDLGKALPLGSPIFVASDGCGKLSGGTEFTWVQDTVKQLGSPLKQGMDQ